MVICPEGGVTVSLGGGASGYGWFLLNPNQALELSSKTEDIITAISSLGRFVDQALERYPVDASRLVLLGFSQGGVMAYGLGLGNPGRFRGVISLSSWLVPDLAKKVIKTNEIRGLPVLVQHGLHDPLIDVSKARQSVDTLRAVQADVTYREYGMGHEITSESLADLTRWLEGTIA
jgi:phospholipase/carboxylesterase